MVWNKCNCEGKRETEALMASRTATVQLGVTGETQGSASIYSPDAMHIGESRGSRSSAHGCTASDMQFSKAHVSCFLFFFFKHSLSLSIAGRVEIQFPFLFF